MTANLSTRLEHCLNRPSLGQALLQRQLITSQHLQVALREQQRTKKLLGETLVTLGFISPLILQEVLSTLTGLGYVDLNQYVLDAQLVALIPHALSVQHRALLLNQTATTVEIAMADPEDLTSVDTLQQLFPHHSVCPLHADPQDILQALEAFAAPTLTQPHPDREVVRLTQDILMAAIKQQASDIHFQPHGHLVRILYRLDGLLREAHTLHRDRWQPLCVRLKVMSGLDIAESRRPQSGRFYLSVGGRRVDFRIATHPTLHGENIVIRILDQAQANLQLAQLGFSPQIVEILTQLAQKPQGLIILSGPTGSGKTTTLYSILSQIDTTQRHVMTLEDPVEYEVAGVRQTEVHTQTLDFGGGVRSILRQDPDVILIGEIRDEETARMALRATITGHLVLSTLHAASSFTVPARLADFGIPLPHLTGYLNAIISQRLVRLRCPHCRQGCDQCHHTGYCGRTVICEVLIMDEELETAFLAGSPLFFLKKQARERGMLTLEEDGQRLVHAGLTTAEEVRRVL